MFKKLNLVKDIIINHYKNYKLNTKEIKLLVKF